jgi:hypothetical protein
VHALDLTRKAERKKGPNSDFHHSVPSALHDFKYPLFAVDGSSTAQSQLQPVATSAAPAPIATTAATFTPASLANGSSHLYPQSQSQPQVLPTAMPMPPVTAIDTPVSGGSVVPGFKIRSPLPKSKIGGTGTSNVFEFELNGPFAVRTHLFTELSTIDPIAILNAASNEHALALFFQSLIIAESLSERIRQRLTTFEGFTIEAAFNSCLPLSTPNSPLKHLTLKCDDITQFLLA